MPNEQTHSAEETIPGEENDKEINPNSNAEQTQPEASGSAPGQAVNGQIDFAQMYDMLTERDKQIKELTSENAALKKSNTELLLKVNSASSTPVKSPYESFIDSMVQR